MRVERFSTPSFWASVVTLLLIAYQLIRVIAFINVYGSIENDGGWMLSISRSLAEHGTYTSMVSSISNPNVVGGINVEKKFDIQAPDGRVWFFTSNGIGPASIIPGGVVLKVVGTSFWGLHVSPLMFYVLMLGLAAYILYQLVGLLGIVLFHAFIFFYPHIPIFLSYEAMGEVPAMFYVLTAYLIFASLLYRKSETSPETRQVLKFFAGGIGIGFAITAKIITIWSLFGVFSWAWLLWLKGLGRSSPLNSIAQLRLRFQEVVGLGLGSLVPIVMWEMVQLTVLTQIAGFEMYLRHARQRLIFIRDDGSGVGEALHSGPEFFWDKFFLLEEVAHPARWVTGLVFLVILLGGAMLIWLWRDRIYKQSLLACLWFGWLANTTWFVTLAKTGWARHLWFGLVLAIMLLSVISLAFVQRGLAMMKQPDEPVATNQKSPAVFSVVFGGLTGVLILSGFLSQHHVRSFFVPHKIVPYWQQRQLDNKYDAALPWIIISRPDQQEIVDYIRQMPPEANVYYPAGHKVAEIPPQTGRIHYPISRRDYVTPHPNDVVIIGPSIIAPWKKPAQRQELVNTVNRQCPFPALKNDFYIICPVEENLPYQTQ